MSLFSRTRLLVTVALAIGLSFAASAAAPEDGALKVGSKRFTESYILAEILAQTAAPTLREPPTVLQGIGNTAIVYEALRSGNIDLYAEYSGTIAQEILKDAGKTSIDDLNAALAPLGLGVAVPLGFNDGYALAMRAADAERLGIRTLSDLAQHPELKFGLSNEFIGRADGWRGMAERYGLRARPTGLDHGLAYEAIGQKQIDVMDIYTTDAKIEHLGLRVLQDDKQYFPRYDAVVLYRLNLPQRLPATWAALQKLQGKINEPTMIAMNARAELKSEPFDVIARDFLTSTVPGNTPTPTANASGERGFVAKLFGPDLLRLTQQHLLLVLVSVILALVTAVPLAIAVVARPRLRAAVLSMASLLQTVPSLALLAILISLTGAIGTLPALVALTLYSLLPIMSNTVTGLAGVPVGLREASTALGMTPKQNLRYVQLPLALPTLVAGVRTATAIAIGTATIAAFIGAGGYGERIVTGLALNDRELLMAGALPAAAMALLSEAFFELLQRWLRPTPTEPASASVRDDAQRG